MSASLPVALPDIGDFKDVPVVEILVKPGDRIAVDDLLISIESDKATMEVPSPVAGVVAEILVAPGTRVSTGTPILTVDTSGEAAVPAAAPRAAPAPEAAPAAALPAPAPDVSSSSDAHATPSVRAYARELGVDLAGIPGTGPQGRILREDVLAFVRGQMAAPSRSPAPPPPPRRPRRPRPPRPPGSAPACRPGRRSITSSSARCGARRCRASSRSPARRSPATG
ncbi:biotin/lipoyl-containing protein [Methylobacterium aquaticum]|uniref:biotin/lipoyl-containing protein n=1 Tax=Methylobacterium aquaticum TaxID=270351 RepID=UPI0032B24E02